MEVIEKLSLVSKSVGFHIVGGTNEDIKYWKEKIKSHNVYFYGFMNQNEIKKYVNSADICLLPNQKIVLTHGNESKINISEYTSPLKMFEYMAAKKAIISSDLPVLREILNENNSVLVDCNDIEEWEKGIRKLEDLAFRKKISQKAYEDFMTKYSWNIRAKNIISAIGK
jgi:glycosyltransferase involved in cell wall biosynthesis